MNCNTEGCDRLGRFYNINGVEHLMCEQCHTMFMEGLEVGISMGERLAGDDET